MAFYTLTTSYKGSLTSNLTIGTIPKPPNTAKEVADQGITVGSWDVSHCNLLTVHPKNDNFVMLECDYAICINKNVILHY
jgi:hypothetical protein